MKISIEKLSIIIPAYNEGPTIHKILDKIKDVELLGNIEKEIIIVNDFSTDDTEESITNYKLKNPKTKIIYIKSMKEFSQI